MDIHAFHELLRPDAQEALAKARGTDPSRLALQLQGSGLPASAIATQLKYLGRAETKLPEWAAAGCLFDPQAFEQCTASALARFKPWGSGQSALDLTCGLGVDTWAIAQSYASVTAIERDRMRQLMARHNLALLAADNVDVWHSDAEDWIRQCADSHYDLIYLDPDRRDEAGGRHFLFSDSSPDVLALQDQLLAMAPRVLIKASPMMDIDAALRSLHHVHSATVMSLDGECKELLLELRAALDTTHTPLRAVRSIRKGQRLAWEGPANPAHLPAPLPPPAYLHEADTAFYKARAAMSWFAEAHPGAGQMNHPEGYLFGPEPIAAFFGRSYRVLHAMPWKPDALRKHFQKLGIKQVNYTRRHFDIPLEQVRQQVKLAEGGTDHLVLTQAWDGQAWTRMAYHAQRADV